MKSGKINQGAGEIQPYTPKGDVGGDWRYNKFTEYRTRYKEETLPLLKRYCLDNKLSLEDRFYMGYLYASSYCVATTLFIYENLDLADPATFWAEYKPKLLFQSDKRYVKNMNWFVPLMEFYRDVLRGNVRELIVNPCKPLESQERWDLLYKKIMKWQYFGRFTTFLMLESIQKLGVVKCDSYSFDWHKGDTATSGAMMLLYMDEKAIAFDASGHLDGEDELLLTQTLKRIKNDAEALKIDPLTVSIETDLCAFRKLFKQSRYYGYYYDRQLEELCFYEKAMPEQRPLWNKIFGYRKKMLDNSILGELQGWDGIRKELCGKFMDTGEI